MKPKQLRFSKLFGMCRALDRTQVPGRLGIVPNVDTIVLHVLESPAMELREFGYAARGVPEDKISPSQQITIKAIYEEPCGEFVSFTGDSIPLFPLPVAAPPHLGRIMVTEAAFTLFDTADISRALFHHLRGECESTGLSQSRSPRSHPLKGCRVLGVYRSGSGRSIWLITEADRSRTAILHAGECLYDACA